MKDRPFVLSLFSAPYNQQLYFIAFTSSRRTTSRYAASIYSNTRKKAQYSAYGASPDLLKLALESKGVCQEVYDRNIQELLLILPSLRSRFSRLSPHLLVGLAEDPTSVAQRLAELRRLFPSADIFRIINRRPSLLLESEFKHVSRAAARLIEIFPVADVSHMVEQQPLLLVEDIDHAIQELKRLYGKIDVLKLLAKDPSILTSVVSNRGLSIWLMPKGTDAMLKFKQNPDILLSIERGMRRLGPGAEF